MLKWREKNKILSEKPPQQIAPYEKHRVRAGEQNKEKIISLSKGQ